MTVFNAWYYSFSPQVAQLITEHSTVRLATRFALYPIIAILRVGAAVYNSIPNGGEPAMVLSGLIIIWLICATYVAPSLSMVLRFTRGKNTMLRFMIEDADAITIAFQIKMKRA